VQAAVGVAPPVRLYEPRQNKNADGDNFDDLEANTKVSIRRDAGGSAGVRGCGMYREERQELGRPIMLPIYRVGRYNDTETG
jgi:hypothetical protein